jgi:hypothetical protein
MERVTREVISDLWPLYVSGEASADTRALVETFLQTDPEFAEKLRENARQLSFEAPPLSPDHELKTFALLKRRIAAPRMLLLLALVFSGFSFGRLVSDTSFDVSPRAFIATAAIAVAFWIAFFVRLFRGRREVMIRFRR